METNVTNQAVRNREAGSRTDTHTNGHTGCYAGRTRLRLDGWMVVWRDSSSSFILLQPFEIAIQTTYKKQITWNGNIWRTLRDRNPAN